MNGEIAIISANFGGFEKPIDDGRITITEEQFPLRDKSMTPRLQARIVKTHMWQFVPDYEFYLWIDSSCKLKSATWFLDKLGGKDIAVFKHPHRDTVQEEADYLKKRLAKDCPYITPRYENEDIDGQLKELKKDIKPNRQLLASTAFICRPSARVKEAFKEWWYQISRYHSIDQLSFPYCIRYCDINIIQDNYENCEGIEYVRNK